MRTDLIKMKKGVGYAYRRRRRSAGGKDTIFVLTDTAVFFGTIYDNGCSEYAVAATIQSGNELPDNATELLNHGIAETNGLAWSNGDDAVFLTEREKSDLLIERSTSDTTTPNRMRFSNLPQEEQDDLFSRFIKERCIACGGNWVAMLEHAIKTDFPVVWTKHENTLPDNGHGGIPRFAALADIIKTCIATEFDKNNNYLK